MNEIRYYAGKLKVKRITSMSASKTALYEILETMDMKVSIGNKNNSVKVLRHFEKGELITAPCRRCFINRK